MAAQTEDTQAAVRVAEHHGGSDRFTPFVPRDLPEVPTQRDLDRHAEGWDWRPGEGVMVKGRAPGPTGGKIDLILEHRPWNCLVHPDRILTKKERQDLSKSVEVEECQQLGIHGVPGVNQ